MIISRKTGSAAVGACLAIADVPPATDTATDLSAPGTDPAAVGPDQPAAEHRLPLQLRLAPTRPPQSHRLPLLPRPAPPSPPQRHRLPLLPRFMTGTAKDGVVIAGDGSTDEEPG